MNFTVTPANIPATEIIAKVEAAVRQLDAEQADTDRRAVNGILQQAEPPEPNITKEMHDALKSLKEEESIMVLPADKGRAKPTYRAKMFTRYPPLSPLSSSPLRVRPYLIPCSPPHFSSSTPSSRVRPLIE